MRAEYSPELGGRGLPGGQLLLPRRVLLSLPPRLLFFTQILTAQIFFNNSEYVFMIH